MKTLKILKRDGSVEEFNFDKIRTAVTKAYNSCGKEVNETVLSLIHSELKVDKYYVEPVSVEAIQDIVERIIGRYDFDVAKSYVVYRYEHNKMRDWVEGKIKFIESYKNATNNANATIDDNSNVGSKNVGVMNNESHKPDNIQISRGIITRKLKELYPDFDSKQYVRDLESHIIYKHDESSFSNPVPYCVSITMYPFLTDGLKKLGGLSASPKNLDSFCGIFCNLIHAVSGQFAGAVAASEFLLYFAYFAKKEWGDDFYLRPDTVITQNTNREMTIESQIEQYFQQILYTVNQPVGSRGLQSVFLNFSYFDKYFFEGMFGNFVFPDYTKPDWESLSWLQKKFMMWFNEERLRCLLTFPVESFALVYKDGHFLDEETAEFVAEEYARGHSFFTYISDTVDSLSSCCRLKNAVTTKEFNFTNGNMGVQTGSKSVITLNLNRIIQNVDREYKIVSNGGWKKNTGIIEDSFNTILERVFKYHVAYNELLWDMKDAHLLTVYDAGFIDLNKQYLTIGLNGLNQAAEFFGMQCTNNEEYKQFCKFLFSTINKFTNTHNGKEFGHKVTLNIEQVPAESLSIKNYNWDKEDGYFVGNDTNLYASYVFKPNDDSLSVLDKLIMHSKQFAADELSGGQAAHINLDAHLTTEQYRKLLNFAGEVGCSYFTWNIPNCECDKCGFIAKQPFDVCPKCGSTEVSLYDRIIGYLTKIKNWSEGRQIEQKTRVYANIDKEKIF